MDTPKRRTLQTLAGLGALAALPSAWAQVRAVELRNTPVSREYDLSVAETPLNITGKPAQGITINGTMPGPVLRFREGDEVVIRVTNNLREVTGIHWHGLLVPNDQDGVPGVTYPGIRPGETFTYRFKLRQSGTYWYHSHAALQEAAGYFAPLIVEPARPDPFQYDRDYIVVISDWIDTPPQQVLANLKKQDGYYNYRRVTTPQFFAQLRSAPDAKARDTLWAERMEWAKMRMDPTDYSDGGDEWSFLLQGKRPDENWTGLFKPGERVRLRFINASPMNLYDVRIPGLPMTVVQADGQNVNPVEVDEFRIGNGETYDVIVQPKEAKAYTIFVPTIARIGYARGTLAPEVGMSAPVPELGPKPVRTMADMGMAGMDMSGGDGMAGMDMGQAPASDAAAAGHAGGEVACGVQVVLQRCVFHCVAGNLLELVGECAPPLHGVDQARLGRGFGGGFALTAAGCAGRGTGGCAGECAWCRAGGRGRRGRAAGAGGHGLGGAGQGVHALELEGVGQVTHADVHALQGRERHFLHFQRLDGGAEGT